MRGQPLQHHGGGGLVVDAVGQFQQTIGRDHPRFGISADRRGAVGNTVAGLEVGNPRADFLDHAGRLAAETARQRHRIKPGAVVDVDKVQSHRGMADARFTGSGLAKLDFLPNQNFGAAGFMEANGVGHESTPHLG